MTKIKKIAAAAAAALSIGAMGMIAFADTGRGDEFALEFNAYEENVYTDSAAKLNSYTNDAEVTIHHGANSLTPVEFSVWDTADELYGYRQTTYATLRANYVTAYMSYDQGGYPGSYDLFYLHANSAYDINISGLWAA